MDRHARIWGSYERTRRSPSLHRKDVIPEGIQALEGHASAWPHDGVQTSGHVQARPCSGILFIPAPRTGLTNAAPSGLNMDRNTTNPNPVTAHHEPYSSTGDDAPGSREGENPPHSPFFQGGGWNHASPHTQGFERDQAMLLHSFLLQSSTYYLQLSRGRLRLRQIINHS